MNSVLSSIPIYFMSSFLLPKWVIDRLDKIRRGFLWGQSENRRGIALVNWKVVCTPKQYGGMGSANLTFRNWALLLRWWWRLYRHPSSLWSETAIRIRSVIPRRSHNVWMRQGSFFWKQLLKIKPIFDMCTGWKISTGSAISYWFDAWTHPIMASLATPQASNRNWSLQKAMQHGLQGVQSPSSDSQPTHDLLVWHWSRNHEYSAQSAYEVLAAGGRTRYKFTFIWYLKIPPTVRFFAFLLLAGKLLTHDIMLSRGLLCEAQCVVVITAHSRLLCISSSGAVLQELSGNNSPLALVSEF